MSTDRSITALAVDSALKKMTDGGHFSICTIDDIVKLLGVLPDPDSYATLRVLHCVSFRAMPRQLLRELPGLIQDCISGPTFELHVSLTAPIEQIAEEPKRRLWPLRLLG